LSAVFTADQPAPAGPGELLSLARLRRVQMLTSTRHVTSSAERHLTKDVNYDCALIRLCASVGIAATPQSFGQPLDARARLEQALAETGIDLAHRAQDPDGPG
jgi:hypothetical protein